jgi:hypothetical protein
MNEFSAVSGTELSQIDGGLLGLVIVGVALAVGGCIDDLHEAGEPLPGFDAFLARTKEIARGR